jgi:putative ABC transport system permease protein
MFIYLRLLKESILFAYQAIKQNRLRTLLSLLGITIGIFSIISVFSLIDSLEKNIRASIESLGTNVIFVQKWPWDFRKDYPWWKYLKRPLPTMEEAKIIRKKSQLAQYVSYHTAKTGTVVYHQNSMSNVEINGIDYYFFFINQLNLKKGRFFTLQEINSGRNYAVIGNDIAKELFENENPLGKKIKVNQIKVIIIGVLQKEGESMIGNSMDKEILIPLNLYGKYFKILSDQSNPKIFVKCKSGVTNEMLKYELKGILRAHRRLKPSEEDNFALNESKMLTKNFEGLFDIIKLSGFLIGIFSILVGGFNIANIMFVSVRERTHEIGIQKAMGAKNSFILFQFLFESVFLSALGGIFGLFFVFLLILILNSLDINVSLSASNLVFGIFLSSIIGVFAGVSPAFSAARLDPVQAIRYKI